MYIKNHQTSHLVINPLALLYVKQTKIVIRHLKMYREIYLNQINNRILDKLLMTGWIRMDHYQMI